MMKKTKSYLRLLTLALTLVMLLLSLPMHIYADTVNVQEIFEKKVHVTEDGYSLNYRLYLPEDYSEDKEYPLILFFQGAGLKGNDNESQLNAGVEQMFTYSNGKVAECIFVVPQCPLLSPDTAKWVDVPNWVDGCSYSTDSIPESVHMRAVVDLLGVIKNEYSTDESRWYVTGLSMGGFATWDIIVRHPEMWAAAVPLCGGADYRKAELIKNMPIWTFHGLNDPTVPYEGTERMVSALEELGSTKIKYTPMAGYAHNIWTPVYSMPDLYMWLFSQVKSVSNEDPDMDETTETITDGNLRVLITSDVHHSTINWYGKTTDERMQLWVDSIKKEHQTTPIDLIIIAGDTSLDVNGTTGSLLNGGKNYTEEFVNNYVSQLREMNIPVYIMAGNHEPYTNEQWKEMTGNDREFSVRVEGNLFICLDNFESNLDMNTSENPVYTVSDVEFAEQEMSKYPDDNVWLVGHWFETPQTPSYRTPESDGFKALLKNDRIKGLFAGHDHKCDVVTTEAAYGSKIIAKTGNFSYTYYTTSLAPNATNTQITDSMWGFRELVITPTEAYSQYILADTTTLSPVHNNVSISNTRRTVHKVEYDVGYEVVPVYSPVTMKHWHFNTTATGYDVRFIGTVAVDDLKDYKNVGIEISIKLQGANEYLLDTSYITQNVYDRFVLGANVVEAGEGEQVYAVDMTGFKNGNVYEITFISFLTQTDGTVIYDLNGETTLTVENGKLL